MHPVILRGKKIRMNLFVLHGSNKWMYTFILPGRIIEMYACILRVKTFGCIPFYYRVKHSYISLHIARVNHPDLYVFIETSRIISLNYGVKNLIHSFTCMAEVKIVYISSICKSKTSRCICASYAGKTSKCIPYYCKGLNI